MKDTLIKSVTTLIGAGLFVYVGWLFFQGYHVVAAESGLVNMLALAICAAISLFLLAIVFMPSVMPTSRWALLVLGVVMILGSHYYLQDDAGQMIYLGDIIKLVGVFLAIVGPMKLLMSKETQEMIEAKDVEIIEV